MIRYLYKTTEREGSGIGIRYPKIKKGKGFIWIYAVNPTPKQLEKLEEDFRIPNRHIRTYTKERRSVRYSFRPFSFVLVDYCVEMEKIKKTNVLYVVGKNFIVTILESGLKAYDDIYERTKEQIKKIDMSVMRLLFEILDEDIQENYEVLEYMEDKITELEKDVAASEGRTAGIREIVNLRRTLNNMSKAFWGSSRITFVLKKGLTPVEPTEIEQRLVGDLHDSFIHQLDIISNQKEMLTDGITIYQTTISNRLAELSNSVNTNIKRLTFITLLLTGIATVIAVPNTLATVFGIPYFPDILQGYWMLIILALIIAIIIPILWFVWYWKKIQREVR